MTLLHVEAAGAAIPPDEMARYMDQMHAYRAALSSAARVDDALLGRSVDNGGGIGAEATRRPAAARFRPHTVTGISTARPAAPGDPARLSCRYRPCCIRRTAITPAVPARPAEMPS